MEVVYQILQLYKYRIKFDFLMVCLNEKWHRFIWLKYNKIHKNLMITQIRQKYLIMKKKGLSWSINLSTRLSQIQNLKG